MIMSKSSTLLLIFILLSSSLLLSAFASASAAKPSVPEFNLKIVPRPFDVAPTATTDPYTGQTKITNGGYHVANVSIDITIKNQPPYTTNYVDGIFVWYQIQFKGAHQTNWQTYSNNNMETPIAVTTYLPQQMGDYTVISIPINSDDPLNSNGDQPGSVTNFPEGGQVDFQVRALIGDINVKLHGGPGFSDWVEFDGKTGDWSNTQTITIENSSPSVTPSASLPSQGQNPTISSSQSSTQIVLQLNVDWQQIALLALLCLVAAVLLVFVVVFLHKRV
jgi:hypothetical protein